MGMISVQMIDVRPDCLGEYEDAVRQVAEEATRRDDTLRWQCRQTIAGELGRYAFIVPADDWKELARIESSEALILRLLGEQEGARMIQRLRECTERARMQVLVDRPDLSYAEGVPTDRPAPFSSVTRIGVQPGRREACEELVRKLAEAIPKVDDLRRFVTYQTLVGDLATIATVTPLQDIAELDHMLPPEDLLVSAFGRAEGSLVFRNGLEAMATVERSLMGLRSDLSHL